MKNLKITAVLALSLGLLLPHQALAWADKSFAFRKPITADAKAGALADGVKTYPVLVRLDSGQFNFAEAQKSGADIRFYDADDKTPLAYQIESFDADLGLAMIWVQVPELPAGGQHKIWMYWGDAKAKDASAAQAFDPDFRAVYHFSGADPARDATAYGATLSSVTTASAGAIGQGASFDGGHGVTVPGSALDPAKGFTFQAWVHEATPQAKAVVYARREGPFSLVVGLQQGAPFVEVNGKRAQATNTVGSNWAGLAVAGEGGKTVLYVNGQQAAELDQALPAMSGTATLGVDPTDPTAGFVGQMDEVRVSAQARSAGWIAADYAGQRQGAKLLAFGASEKPSGEGFGYFGIIFKNITPDAWAVIAVLGLMGLLSWIVMWAKGAYVGAISRRNRAFESAFRALGREDLLALDPARSGGATGLEGSSLYRLYRTGVEELHARGDLKGRALTEETVAAIRAALDATQVEENQKLDRFMVLLTIAISGGPFIGLLGTVLGVMITFAAIAAAGDVNVNAIAPGIAAALMATVAGLFVAIPALFGYNYLSSRNSAVSAKMQVFADQFITRLAEVQRDAADRR